MYFYLQARQELKKKKKVITGKDTTSGELMGRAKAIYTGFKQQKEKDIRNGTLKAGAYVTQKDMARANGETKQVRKS